MTRSERWTLAVALVDQSTLASFVRPGCEAIESRHRGMIEDSERERIADSLDLDSATRAEFPNENRWDYLVSVADAKVLVAVEPHTARDSEIEVVIRKKSHAVRYLSRHIRQGHRVGRWIWVSSRSRFSRMEKARRRLDQAGIKFAGRLIRSLTED